MKPKKREKEKRTPLEPRIEARVQADHELFLQAFEKPTQIYRYLRARNGVLPLFLSRNLTYMRRKDKKNVKRLDSPSKPKTFRVDSLLSTVEKKQKDSHANNGKLDSMSLTFRGLYSPELCLDLEYAEVELILLKVCQKRRKDQLSPALQTSLGKVKVPMNPISEGGEGNAISISQEHFHPTNGHTVRSYLLIFRVACPLSRQHPNGICNGDLTDSDEPPIKRRKNGRTWAGEGDTLEFSAELNVFDRWRRCQLISGEYELALQSVVSHSLQHRHATWETVTDGKDLGPFEAFSKCPALKFTISWTQPSQANGQSFIQAAQDEFISNNHLANHILDHDLSGTKRESVASRLRESQQTTPRKRVRIFYQFQYNNNTRQLTEARDDLRCPWCSLAAPVLYSLLKHLRLCHARFNFIYVPHPKGDRIDVSINERYDGSYVGNPQDLHSPIGYAFGRKGPVRRTPVTNVIVYRPKRAEPQLTEFIEPESDTQVNRQFVQGHNRLYYHTITCQPVRPQEIDVDSEEENDPLWLRQKTINMIDEFTDVNEGEKELMKLWNLHIMKHNYIADCQIPTACYSFVDEHGEAVIRQCLEGNLLLHLVNLFDFSLIKPEVVQQTITRLEQLKERLGLD